MQQDFDSLHRGRKDWRLMKENRMLPMVSPSAQPLAKPSVPTPSNDSQQSLDEQAFIADGKITPIMKNIKNSLDIMSKSQGPSFVAAKREFDRLVKEYAKNIGGTQAIQNPALDQTKTLSEAPIVAEPVTKPTTPTTKPAVKPSPFKPARPAVAPRPKATSDVKKN